MKKICLLLLTVVALVACEGPAGPPGLDGSDGLDGSIVRSTAFEIQIDFTAANNYSHVEGYGFEVEPSEVTLVYILWGLENGKDVWRLLPQQVYFEEGLFQYNFDFTDVDVQLFADATFPLENLDDEWLVDQVFRIVVVPADLIGRVDYSNYDAMMLKYGIEDNDFQKRN